MAATVVPGANTILEVLNLNNYEDWSFRVETYLMAKGLWDVVKATAETPNQEDDTEYRDWSTKNAKALYAIQNSCGSDVFCFIRDCRKAKDAWKTLEEKLKLESTDEGLDERQLKDLEMESVVDVHVEAVDEHRHGSSGMPALHKAVLEGKLELLMWSMTEEGLEVRDTSGRTALCATLISGRLEPHQKEQIAKQMVELNHRLLSIVDPSTNMIPLVMAYSNFQQLEAVARYLYSVTPLDTMNVHQGAELVSLCIRNKIMDAPMGLIGRYPTLGFTKDLSGKTPLYTLADACDLYPSELKLTFWQQLIYNCIRICNMETDMGHLTLPDVTSLPSRGLLKLFGGDWILDEKLLHKRADHLLNRITGELDRSNNQNYEKEHNLLRAAVFRAIEKGQFGFIKRTILCVDEFALATNEEGRTMLQHAADCREEKIYSLLYGFVNEFSRHTILTKDKFDNNILHTVGSFSPQAQAKIAHIRGAALQMQREMQWFTEVLNDAPLECRNATNKTDQLQPVEVFVKYHKDLMKEGETSMKDIATSCTVVGALIVTMMFAAAFTIPGGNDGDTGLPIFSNSKAFMIFIVSDAISLFSSTTSVMIFLGILTSRYEVNDFLKTLPSNMIASLFTLFLSVATMMIAFSAALYITLQGKLHVVVPLILLSCVPIASFVRMQFPFFVEILISTYGKSIFVKYTALDLYTRLIKPLEERESKEEKREVIARLPVSAATSSGRAAATDSPLGPV